MQRLSTVVFSVRLSHATNVGQEQREWCMLEHSEYEDLQCRRVVWNVKS